MIEMATRAKYHEAVERRGVRVRRIYCQLQAIFCLHEIAWIKDCMSQPNADVAYWEERLNYWQERIPQWREHAAYWREQEWREQENS